MATSGEAREAYSGRSNFKLRIALALDSTDAANNRSKWDYSLRVDNDANQTATWSASTPTYSIVIEGTTVASGTVPAGTFDFRDGDDYHNIKLGTTGWINHDPNGNLTLNFSAQTASIATFGSASPSGSFAANRIARAPGVPGTPTISAINPTGATVSWTAASRGNANIDYYRLEWSTSASFPNPRTYTDQNNLSRAITGLTPGTTYYVRVWAHSADGFGPVTPTVSFLTTPSGAPTLVSVNSGLSGAFATLVMSPPAGSSTVGSYTIYNRLMPSGPWTQVASGSASNTQTVGGLIPGSTYQWKVTATFGSFVTLDSNVISETQERPSVDIGSYFDGSFPDTADQDYAWTGTAHNSPSTASGFAPTGWISFATGATSSGGTGSVVRVPGAVTVLSGVMAGERAAQATFTTDATAAGFAIGTTTVPIGRADIVPSQTYVGSAYVKVSRSQRMAVAIAWVDTAGAPISTTLGEAQIVPANTWTRLLVTAVAPPTADFAGVRVRDVAGDGWSLFHSGDYITMDAVMLSIGSEGLPYFDGSFPDDEFYQYSWEGTAHASASLREEYAAVVLDPLIDPDCAVVPAPPRPPVVLDECIDETGVWIRYWSEIPASEVSDWMTVLPTFVLRTEGFVLRQVRIRVYANPFNYPIGIADTTNWCSEQIISYIPGGTTFTLDGPLKRAFAEVQGGSALAADHLLYGTGGTPASWPELSCGITYLVSYDIPADTPIPIGSEEDQFEPVVYLTNRM